MKKATAKERTIEEQVREVRDLSPENFLKLDVGKFCLLREKANPEQRKQLDYLFERANLEHTIRKICREELAKAGLS